jgi:hypothetical protein
MHRVAVDVDVLDSRFDGAHEEQFLALVDCSFAQLSYAPHVGTRKILVAKDKLDVMCLVLFFIGL